MIIVQCIKNSLLQSHYHGFVDKLRATERPFKEGQWISALRQLFGTVPQMHIMWCQVKDIL